MVTILVLVVKFLFLFLFLVNFHRHTVEIYALDEIGGAKANDIERLKVVCVRRQNYRRGSVERKKRFTKSVRYRRNGYFGQFSASANPRFVAKKGAYPNFHTKIITLFDKKDN